MDETLRAHLVEAAGRGAVDAGRGAVTPHSSDALLAVCRVCAAARAPMRPLSSPPPATPHPGGAVTISLSRLHAVAVDAGALAVRAEAGATVAAVREAAARHGLTPAVALAGGAGAPEHVGSMVARGGVARRGILGIEVVLGTGERVVVGGSMPKDVAPYDIAAAMVGSGGRLGIVVAVTLRLQPSAAALGIGHDAPGPLALTPLDEVLRAAFDPDGLLVPA